MGNTSSSSASPHNIQNSPSRPSSRRTRSTTAPSAAHSPATSTTATSLPADSDPSHLPQPTTLEQQQQQSHQQPADRDPKGRFAGPHRSLRTKKKSLELPDLALALTPGSSPSHALPHGLAPHQHPHPHPHPHAPYQRRPQPSSPIAIPHRPLVPAYTTQAQVQANAYAAQPGASQLRNVSTDVIVPVGVNAHAGSSSGPSSAAAPPGGQGRGRGQPNPHIRGAMLTYNSTRSFAGQGGAHAATAATAGASQSHRPAASNSSFVSRGHFVPEDVHSSIPLALRKAEYGFLGDDDDADTEKGGDRGRGASPARSGRSASRGEDGLGHGSKGSMDERRTTEVPIVWRGGGKSVALIRAGDDDWKGHQPMQFDPDSHTHYTTAALPPGTHHIRFVVDGVVMTAEDLPTAVDDGGTLANYVAVPISGYTPPTGSAAGRPLVPSTSAGGTKSPGLSQSHGHGVGTGASFFENGSDIDDTPSRKKDADPTAGGTWTTVVPWQLECAAEEEEQWLAMQHHGGHGGGGGGHGDRRGRDAMPVPPQHPMAPALPRHLEKLIMNTRGRAPPVSSQRDTSASRERDRVSALRASAVPPSPNLPVTTASGTNLSSPYAYPSTGSASATAAATAALYTKLDTHREERLSPGWIGASSNANPGVHGGGGLADDNSVLPVPSHVVLHHLGTSAIRNGVLAVADTVRYRKKYITTIFYKPT